MIKRIILVLFLLLPFCFSFSIESEKLDECPKSAGAALLIRYQKALLKCDEETLREYYNTNDCCIVNIAECNYIEKAWWTHVNVLEHEPLCKYGLRHPEHMKHFRRRSFLRRIKARRLQKLIHD